MYQPGKQHVTRCFLFDPCDAATEGLFRGGVLRWIQPEGQAAITILFEV
jgi:hypothetical protein